LRTTNGRLHRLTRKSLEGRRDQHGPSRFRR
jgi:hypothetical protein